MQQGEQPSKWIQGLVFFLAVILRPFWENPIFRYEKRVAVLSWPADQIDDILKRVPTVLAFVRQSCRDDPPVESSSSSSAAHRCTYYTMAVTKRKAALLRATKLLHSILSILDRLCEALGVLRVLHSHQFLPSVLKSTLLPAPLAHRLADTTLGRMLEQP